ncbi:hypothetical protein N7470_007302 [Penicillium chermesinum]|nr:hypothetical protein N7470_007302 [Penicillium chermesinum]
MTLKLLGIYEPPSPNATARVLWDYSSETVFHYVILKDEREVLQLLADHPHPNIIEVIDVDQPEGIYLRKYQQFSDLMPAPQMERILWYQEILRALSHLHELGITHSDIRIDNILFNFERHALLSDFGASCPFGYPNPSLLLLMNGVSDVVSDVTDRFAMASMIYELETGGRPDISINSSKELYFPTVQTGDVVLDALIQNAWQGSFDSTLAMLRHAEKLGYGRDIRQPTMHSVSKTELREQNVTAGSRDERRFGSRPLLPLPTSTKINEPSAAQNNRETAAG